jgi:hypothetical protein
VHPYTLKPVKTVKTKEEKLNQNRFFFWYKRENREWIKSRLQKVNRPDLAERLLGDEVEEKKSFASPKKTEKKHTSTNQSHTKSDKKRDLPPWLANRRKK